MIAGGSAPIVEAVGLMKEHRSKKALPAVRAVDGIDFELLRGEAFGFLGPNGAGKSSTMRMIGCVSPPSGGRLRVLGMDSISDARRIRARLGVVPQDDSLDPVLTVRENLLVYGSYFGLPARLVRRRADELLEFAQLRDRGAHQVASLSGGMRRRLVIARALLNDPDILLLDEPTTGLDPQARHLLWERLHELRDRGVTLVLTTHYMDEAEQLCDRIAVMDNGRFAAQGRPSDLIAAHAAREVLELRYPEGERDDAVAEIADEVPSALVDRIEVLSDRLLIYTSDADKLLATVLNGRHQPRGSLVRRGSLEDVFLALTGRNLVD